MEPITSLEENNNYDSPIILLDYSGSVKSIFNGTETIFDHMLKLVKDVANYDKFKNGRIIIWSTEANYFGKIIIDNNFAKNIKTIISEQKIKPGQTDLSSGFNIIENIWFNKNRSIYILTDGEINEDKYGLKNI